MSVGVATSSLSTVRATAETASTFLDVDYWLAHCEGYSVRSTGGRVGIVETVQLAEHVDRAESLTVLAGRFGRRRLVIDAGQVAAVVPHEQQVFLKPGATIVGSEPASMPVGEQ